MRILVVAPWVPSVRRPRSFGLLTELATRHEVTVVAATWSDEDRDDLDRLAVQRTRSVPLSRWRGAARAGLALGGRGSLQQAYLDAPELRRAVREEATTIEPDLTYFNVIRSAQFADEVSGPKIIDLDEFRSSYYEQLATTSRSPAWRLLGRVEGRRMAVAEQRAIDDVDLLLVSSPSDLTPDRTTCRLVRSPHQMPPPSTDPSPAPDGRSARPSIVFVGRLSYRANVEAVRWFATEVLPHVVEHRPEVVFEVVGAAPHRSLRRLEGPNVEVVGPVPEVAPFYSRAQVSVVPVRLATGVQMKLIESLSLGVATVTTSNVARLAGIDAPGPCLAAEGAEDWADAVGRLLDDAALRDQVRSAGARWAVEHYDARAIADDLHTAIEEATRSSTPPAAEPEVAST
jgi:glycosyltransferase involved in cell wall biosynthesis